MGLPPWETSESQLFALITGANSGLGFSIAARMIDEFITSPSTPPNKHLVLILCTRTPLKTRFTISRLRAHLRIAVEFSVHGKKQRARAKAEGWEYKWEKEVLRVHFLGAEVDLCDLKSVYALADQLVNKTVGSPDATTMDGGRLPHGSPGTQTYSEDIKQDRWALSQKPGHTGPLRSWGWGLSGIRLPRLDVIILTAGIGGWTGLNWFQTIRDVLLDPIEATTWPTYKLGKLGAVVRSQSTYKATNSSEKINQPLLSKQESSAEPPLGEVFCSNVFGHYILVHELMSLLSRPATSTSKTAGKIIWMSSVEALPEHFSLDDIQALKSTHAYEDSKRLIDLLSLTSDLPSTKRAVASYFDASKTITASKSIQSDDDREALPLIKPTIYLTHPGIFLSDILYLPGILAFAWKLLCYCVRWFGSPWHPVIPYKAAVAPTWLALTDSDELAKMEADGTRKAKWGSSTNSSGDERVRKTEVGGWGWHGAVEDSKENIIGRKKGAIDVTKEAREDFEVLGGKCWEQMEELRKTWEEVLELKNS